MSFSKSIKHCRRCISISARHFHSESSGAADAPKMVTKVMSLTQWKVLNQLKEYYNKYSADKNFQQLFNKEWAAVLQKIQPTIYGSKVIRNFDTTVTKDDVAKTDDKAVIPARKPESDLQIPEKADVSLLPNVFTGFKLKLGKNEPTTPIKIIPKWRSDDPVSKSSIMSRTHHVISMINSAETDTSRLKRIEDLIAHVQQYPEAKHHACKEGAVRLLLRIREFSNNPEVIAVIREAFAVLGYFDPLPRRGIRILSIDGGGIRGLLVICMLRKLEELTGIRTQEMFDLICGVSTGAIIACGLGATQKSLWDIETYYKELSLKVFTQNAFWGTSNLVWSHAYYDTKIWEGILKTFYGEPAEMIKTNRKANTPKVAAVSAVVNQSRANIFVFRNYDLPYRVRSQYMGSSKYKVWQAVRASSAAPTFFEEFKLGDLLHQDGGIMVNNPTAVAIHEARQIWPNRPIQCVVSFGTGRTNHSWDPIDSGSSSSWKNKFLKILDSATDTESVHMTLNDLLPPNTYFRFNPYLTEMLGMTEIRDEKIDVLERDAMLYLRKNEEKFQGAAKALLEKKSYSQQAVDWFNVKREILGAKISN